MLCSFNGTILFIYPLGPWPVQPYILGYVCNVREEFYLMEMDLNQISVFYPYKLCDTRAFCRQVTKRFVICNLISIYISPFLGYIPVPQTQVHRGKDSRLAPVQLLCVSCVIYVLLLAKGLTINLWRASNIFVNNLCGLGIPMRPF